MMSLADTKLSLHQRVATAEVEAHRLRNELSDRDARYEEQALILQERMQAAEEEAQARGEKLAKAQSRIAELEAERPAPDPGGPLRLDLDNGGFSGYYLASVDRGGDPVLCKISVNAAEAQMLRDLVRAYNVLHGEDDENDRAFGIALHDAAGRMYRRQADKAAEGVIRELCNGWPVDEAVRARVAEIIYAEMSAGSLAGPDGEGEEVQP